MDILYTSLPYLRVTFKICDFVVNDIDIIAGEFSDFFNITVYFHSNCFDLTKTKTKNCTKTKLDL